jgi:CheY-like chemotaxis protein
MALEANRAKDAFLAVVSHELRTPLTGIIGHCDLWLEADELDSQEMLEDLRKIHLSGHHQLTIVNDILDWAKIEAGKLKLEMAPFELKPMIAELRDLSEPLTRKNNNKLVLDCAADLGSLYADRTRVRQILFNLLSNSGKFTERGTVELRVSREAADGRDWVIFRVRDTGKGMKPDDVKKLFQPFVQADSSSTRKTGGTGLGLVICRKLCDLMGGTVTVQSEWCVGSTFTVRLPAQPEVPAEEPPSSKRLKSLMRSASGPGDNTVLVIDDDPTVRELMERFLSKQGFTVRSAANGADGLLLARELRPSIITLDVMMPGMDGWAVLTALKSDPATADIPIIMASIVDDQRRGFALGVTDYLTKPVNWNRLSTILRQQRIASRVAPILVVEDNPSIREVTARQLKAQGWGVLEAENGRVALDRLATQIPALILLDLLMPVMDGFQFVEEFRRHPEWQSIPIVVVTAADLNEADRQRLNGSVEQIMQKNAFTPEQLLDEIQKRVRQWVRE